MCEWYWVMSVEPRPIRDERTILSIAVTDFTDSIIVKMFVKNEQLDDMYGFIRKGNFLKIKGIAAMDKYDQEITISNVSGIRKGTDNRSVGTATSALRQESGASLSYKDE